MPSAAQTFRALPLHGAPLWLLRLEGAVLLLAASWFYASFGLGWLWYLVLFLAPDLSMLFYFAGVRLGAIAYNFAHTTLPPFILGGVGELAGNHTALALAAIWFAHIGFDRMLGYGLKYATGFQDTHLGRIGRGT
ncbi:DUF4260 domain-containing protein [Acidocella sp.]|uniref:DUF4260 domain-containing protein n=1 Tax=Acidocella sp. TaxID=50710 RepID=UPI003D09512E